MPRPLIAFAYFGGKSIHLKNLIPLIPKHRIYVEPFMGGLSVLLNKPRAEVDIVNDKNDEIVNFFRVLRDRPDDLIQQLQLTPYARTEYAEASSSLLDDDIERSRKFFVRISLGWGGIPIEETSSRQWAPPTIREKSHGRDARRRGKESQFLDAIDKKLPHVSHRLRGVAIENDDALAVIKRYDHHTDTFYYVDPPYVANTRTQSNVYTHEMIDSDHEKLHEVLNGVQGNVMLSGYPSELYDDLYWDWYRKDFSVVAMTQRGNTTGQRTECVWMNYDPEEV